MAPRLGRKRSSSLWTSILKLRQNTLSISEWRRRNGEIYAQLLREGYVDSETLSAEIVQLICEELINESNPAAQDSLNAGHIRSQNENILFLAAMANIPPRALAICITAGFIHDLNKTVGEPLRQDRYGVRDKTGKKVRNQTNLALSVGMNHLGNRTRKVLYDIRKRHPSAIHLQVVREIDECIIHHGIGSSRFIKGLFSGENPWWRDIYWNKSDGGPKYLHPPQPSSSVSTVVHDLADSAQQMQGDSGWLQKYPFGYWAESNLSFWQMFWACRPQRQIQVAQSLAEQVILESQTCFEIIEHARTLKLLTNSQLVRLEVAVRIIAQSSEQWLARSVQEGQPPGYSLLTDLMRETGYSETRLKAELKKLRPYDSESHVFKEVIARSSVAKHGIFRTIVAESLSNGPIYWCQE
ncbi:MAG: hypothetical protein VYC39_20450 [Myxococcota bacterium]|nr:hypothetical protein [Myxococcota bacterium]